jgi:hypothetical protein
MQHNFRNLRRPYAALSARQQYQDCVTRDMIHIPRLTKNYTRPSVTACQNKSVPFIRH